MNTDIKSMFDSIKNSLNAPTNTGAAYRNFLKIESGKNYLVRLIPDITNPENTFYHYLQHGFNSPATGQYIEAICPRSYNERCPICEYRFQLYKTKNEEDRQLAYLIRATEKHLVNVYVVTDPTTPENEGSIKVLRFGKSIHGKFLSATEGDDADEFGSKIYDLSEAGCNFKIKAEQAADGERKFTNYNNSRFTAPGAIPNMSKDKMLEIYKSIFKLPTLIETKTTQELEDIIHNHIKGESSKKITVSMNTPANNNEKHQDDSDDGLNEENVEEKSTNKSSSKPDTTKIVDSDRQSKIKNMLADLENL